MAVLIVAELRGRAGRRGEFSEGGARAVTLTVPARRDAASAALGVSAAAAARSGGAHTRHFFCVVVVVVHGRGAPSAPVPASRIRVMIMVMERGLQSNTQDRLSSTKMEDPEESRPMLTTTHGPRSAHRPRLALGFAVVIFGLGAVLLSSKLINYKPSLGAHLDARSGDDTAQANTTTEAHV